MQTEKEELEFYRNKYKEEKLYDPYLGDKYKSSISIQMTPKIVERLETYARTQIYSKARIIEFALINLMNNTDDMEIIKYIRAQKEENDIKSIGVTISRKLSNEWDAYCEKLAIYAWSHLVTCAIQKYLDEHNVG